MVRPEPIEWTTTYGVRVGGDCGLIVLPFLDDITLGWGFDPKPLLLPYAIGAIGIQPIVRDQGVHDALPELACAL